MKLLLDTHIFLWSRVMQAALAAARMMAKAMRPIICR
jgi:PIN domain nuclease of toxin-antitoxin system